MRLGLIDLIIKDIKRRKLSSFLTLFAISLGILSIFVIVLISEGFSNSIEKQFESFGTNRLYVASSTSSFASESITRGLLDSDIKFIESRPFVEEVFPYYFKTDQIKFGNEFQYARLIGTTLSEKYFESFDLDAEDGRLARESEKYSLVVGPVAATDTFSKDLQVGSNVYIKDVKFKVVGILESLGNPEDDKAIYLNIDTLREINDAGNSVGVADIVINEGYDMTSAKENLETLLDNRLGEDIVEVISPDSILDQLNSILGIVNSTLGGIAFVSLIVGAFGIINTMYVIVTEKTKDIGIMKSIGATNFDILFLYMFQAGVFGFLGALFGVTLGSLAVIGFESAVQGAGYAFLEISIDYMIGFYLLLFGFLIGMFSGFLPAYKASKLTIVESIRK